MLIPGVGVRLPPRAPYETGESLSLFCQSILDRKAENPLDSMRFPESRGFFVSIRELLPICKCYDLFGSPRTANGRRRST